MSRTISLIDFGFFFFFFFFGLNSLLFSCIYPILIFVHVFVSTGTMNGAKKNP